MRLFRQRAVQSHLRPITAGVEWQWITIVASRSSKQAPFTPVWLRCAPQFISTSVHSKLAGPAHHAHNERGMARTHEFKSHEVLLLRYRRHFPQPILLRHETVLAIGPIDDRRIFHAGRIG